jgi:predicted PurR-regulated permease PerM
VNAPSAPSLPPGERLRRAGIAAWSIIGLLILAAIAVWLLYRIRIIFPPLVLALLVIYLLNPPISRLERRGMPRGLAATIVFVATLALIVVIGIALFPFLSDQVANFADEWPQFRHELVVSVENAGNEIEDRTGINVDTRRITCLLGGEQAEGAVCDEVTSDFSRAIGERAGQLTAAGRSILELLITFILAPLLALYLLIDLPQLQRDLLNLVPPSHRDEAADLGSKTGRAVGGFFRGQLFVALTVGVLSAIGFKLIGLPFWLVIGAIAGFFNLIPLIGPYIGGAIGFIVGTVSGGFGLGLKAALVELIVQQIDNHFVSPQVMKRTVQLHPATVMLALLAGGTVAGFWGVLLGVPAVAVAKILLSHLWSTRVLGDEVTPYRTTRGREPPAVVPETGTPSEGEDLDVGDASSEPPSDEPQIRRREGAEQPPSGSEPQHEGAGPPESRDRRRT